MKHTPERWIVFEHADHSGICIGPEHEEEYLKGHVRDVCEIPSMSGCYPYQMSEEQRAHARLISAAPIGAELAEAVLAVFASKARGTTAREYPAFDTLPTKEQWVPIFALALEFQAKQGGV